MQEILAQVFTYAWGVWRYRWLALVIAWVVAIGGWLWVWQLPESYVATARIQVDTNTILRPLLKGLAIQPDIDQRINLMTRTLLSRPNLEKLMRMTDLDLEVSTEKEKNDMLSALGNSIGLGGSKDNISLYSISVRDADRDMAKRITQSLITVFIESSLSDKRQGSSGAQDFLDDQILEYEERLVAAESRLALFKQENVDVLAGIGGGYYGNLQAARQDLEAARLSLGELQNRRQELQRQLVGEDPVFISSSVTGSLAGSSPLDARIQSMRAALDNLSIRYTDKHPEVRQLSALIEELEAEKTSEYQRVRENTSSSGGLSGYSNSPVYQGMRSMLAQTEANIAELEVRVAEYGKRVAGLESMVSSVPEIEAESKQLDRDYKVILAKHQALLERREAARMSEDVEQSASDVTFRVIDPPFVPLEPSEPNKAMLNAAVLLAGLAAGVGVGLLLSLIFPVVVDGRSLVNLSGLPLLGAVTINLRPEQKRKDRYALLTFATLGAGLLIAYAGLSLGQSGLLLS